jgi:hypothetical protein
MKWIIIWFFVPAALLGILAYVSYRKDPNRGHYNASSWTGGLAVISIILAVFGTIMVILYFGMGIVCRNKADTMELPHQFSLSAGCLVEVDGRYYPIEQVQNVGGRIVTTPGDGG